MHSLITCNYDFFHIKNLSKGIKFSQIFCISYFKTKKRQKIVSALQRGLEFFKKMKNGNLCPKCIQ